MDNERLIQTASSSEPVRSFFYLCFFSSFFNNSLMCESKVSATIVRIKHIQML